MKHSLDAIRENRMKPLGKPVVDWSFRQSEHIASLKQGIDCSRDLPRQKRSPYRTGLTAPKEQNVSVAVKQGYTVTPNHYTIRIPITIRDKESGELVEITMKTVMNELNIVGYGAAWTWRKSSRGNSVMDSRDGKRKALPYIAAELRRLLGDYDGKIALAALLQ
jgi:hypothetical protein